MGVRRDRRYLRDCVRGFHEAREDGDRTELILNAVVPLVQRAEASELGPFFGGSGTCWSQSTAALTHALPYFRASTRT